MPLKKDAQLSISDFMDDDFETALKISKNKHDVVAIQTVDPRRVADSRYGIIAN